MQYGQAKANLTAQLSARFGEGEARAMSRLIWEAIFQKRLLPAADLELSAEQSEKLAGITTRILDGEPIQYVLEHTWFYGLPFRTDSRALIPRPETEELVHWILETNGPATRLRVLDIGAGSGCIAVTLKKKRPLWDVTALDVSEAALALTLENARLHDCSIDTILQDMLDPTQWLQWGQWDIMVSNPPYIPQNERRLMPEQVLRHEPESALFVPDDKPLLFYEAISRFAMSHLESNGALYLEINEFYAQQTQAYLRADGWRDVRLQPDLQGKMRMIRACKHC